MAKQYTFKTTKKTAWMESMLDSVVGDRSTIIRDLIILGMKASGMQCGSDTQMKYNVTLYQTSNVTQVSQGQTQQIYTEEPTNTEYSPSALEEEPEIETLELTVDDLEAKLNSFQFE